MTGGTYLSGTSTEQKRDRILPQGETTATATRYQALNTTSSSQNLIQIIKIIMELLDDTLFEWVETKTPPTPKQIELASVAVGDRRRGALTDP
ncbi:XamI family restriction endonuclease, partial [Gleimia europaea]|nr:XamI family restriction endonuclease [Gleimia europaea]